MTAYSPVHSIKSNARRAARKAGLDPNIVTACAGGFHYPLNNSPPKAAPKAKPTGKTKTAKTAKPAEASKRAGKTGGLLKTVLEMITAKGGATMPEIIKATGWLPHTARARISGIVKANKLTIERERLFKVTTYKASKTA